MWAENKVSTSFISQNTIMPASVVCDYFLKIIYLKGKGRDQERSSACGCPPQMTAVTLGWGSLEPKARSCF